MKSFKRAHALVLAFFLSIGLAACDFAGLNDAVDQFKLIIGLEEIATPVSVKFIDAESGELVSGNVELSFAGVDADAVVDLFNEPIVDGRGRYPGGVAAFGIANDVEPTPSDPVALRLTARANGYEPQVKNVQISQAGRQSVIVRLTATGTAPEGGAATRVEEGATDDSGTVTEPVHVSTPPTPQTAGSASVSVPTGTVARTADGLPLKGKLTTSITYASAETRESLASLPGGYQAEVEGTSGGALTTVGFANITVSDADGNRAKTFTQPIEIGIDLVAGATNPLTGAAISEGDALEVFSFDLEEGVWRREGSTTVALVNGRPRAVFNAEHLSTWSVGGTVETCDVNFDITTNGNTVTSVKAWNGFFSETFSVPAAQQQLETVSLTLTVPSGAGYEYEVRGTTVYTGSVATSCGGAVISLPAPAAAVPVTIESSVAPCPAGQSLKAGYEGDYGLEVAEIVSGSPDWESAQTVTVSVTTDGNEIRGAADLVVKGGAEYRVQGSFNEEEITGGFSAPVGVGAGEVIAAEIDNEITDDVAADACE